MSNRCRMCSINPDTPRVYQRYEYTRRIDYGRWKDDNYFSGIDRLWYEFKPEYKKVNFHDVIYTNFPQVVEIIEPRVAENYYVDYAIYYEEGYRLGESPTFDSSGFSISLVPAYNDLRARGITPMAVTISTPSVPPVIGIKTCAKPPWATAATKSSAALQAKCPMCARWPTGCTSSSTTTPCSPSMTSSLFSTPSSRY